MLSRAELTIRKNDTDVVGQPTGQYCDVILYFGIIDILQDYDIGKKIEHAYKSFQYDSTSISAVDPRQYSRRFRDFIYNAFQEDRAESWKFIWQNVAPKWGLCKGQRSSTAQDSTALHKLAYSIACTKLVIWNSAVFVEGISSCWSTIQAAGSSPSRNRDWLSCKYE